MKKVLKRIGIALLIFLLLDILAVGGIFLYHRAMLKKEAPLREKKIGTPVTVDGGTMYVYSEGEGDQTVVFLSGYATASPIYDFRPLYRLLSDDFRIAVVEKFGYGFSDETDLPRDIDTMLSETRQALAGAGIEGPFLLCPHSASGMEALYWAQQYPEEITGIVFSDAAIPGSYDANNFNSDAPLDKAMAWTVNLGFWRIFSPDKSFPALESSVLTDEEKDVYRALFQANRGNKTLIHEAEAGGQNMAKVEAGPVPDIPMIFFTTTGYIPANAEEWCSVPDKYTNGTAENNRCDCGHYVHVERAEEMADAVRRMAAEIAAEKGE